MDKKDDDYKFDVYTEHDWEYKSDYRTDHGVAIGLTDGYIESDMDFGSPNPLYKSLRESSFPLDRILKSINIDIKKAVATFPDDAKYIKNIITNQNIKDDPLPDHGNYDKLNNLIRGFFICSNLTKIINDVTIESNEKLKYFEILKQSSVEIFSLDMKNNKNFDDKLCYEIAINLPSSLKTIRFLSKDSHITNNDLQIMLNNFSRLSN